MEFNPGDRIIEIYGSTMYMVLKCQPNWYELMSIDHLAIARALPTKYVDDHFVLVESAYEPDKDDEGAIDNSTLNMI